MTVLDIKNELFISVVNTAAIIGVFIYELFVIDVNYFDHKLREKMYQKQLQISWILVVFSIMALYMLRLLINLNAYFFLFMVSSVFIVFCVIFCHILGINNNLLE